MNGKVMLKGVPYFSDTQVIELTRAEYDALPASKYTDGILYCIKDEGVMKGDTFSPIIYSLAEREVGVWVDGKPLYQKSFEVTYNTTGSGNVNIDVNHQISDLDTVVVGYATVKSNSNTQYILYHNPDVTTQDVIAISYVNSSIIRLTLGHNYRSNYSLPMKFSITLQYTKTTDNPGTGQWTTSGVPAHHYSTSEQIVGTWIDGKPLYEKTIVGNTLGNSSTTTTLFTATVEMIHKYDTVLKNASGNVVNSNMLYNGSYHYRVAVDSNGTRMYLTRNDVSVWQDWYPVVTIQYTKITD